jgi:plastocyanin
LGGVLVLGAVCSAPALSAAQDAGTTTAIEPAGAGLAPAQGGQPIEAGLTAGGAPVDKPEAAPKAQKAASVSVSMGDFFFSPATVSIAVGDTVTWRNNGDAPHNAAADDGSFRTPDLNKGQSASETFTQQGTFSYICTIHPNMKGTVQVLASSAGGGGSGGGGSGGGSGGGGSGSGTSDSIGSAPSEASAVASPDAAGDSDTLPATGMAVGGLALVGLALLASGLLVRGTGRRWLTPF